MLFSPHTYLYYPLGFAFSPPDLTATFRGRPLNGQEVVLPAGYTGNFVFFQLEVDEKQKKLKAASESLLFLWLVFVQVHDRVIIDY